MNLWREYSLSYVKNNKTSSLSILIASFISTVLLSLVCSIFYNIWVDEVTRNKLEAGSKPSLVMLVYVFILALSCASLILIIHNAFGISMRSRLHQLGILQSIGASPRQLLFAMVREAMLLCLIPIVLGVLTGGGLCFLFMKLIINITMQVRKYTLAFEYSPFLFLAAFLISLLTVWLSAWIPARRISRIAPLQALLSQEEPRISRMKKFRLLSGTLGIEAELARKSLYARRSSFRTASMSLMLAFMVLCTFLNMEKISDLSTQHTFFERYKDRWDLMLSTIDNGEDKNTLLSSIREIPGVKSSFFYHIEKTYTSLPKKLLSNELKAIGGLESLTNTEITEESYQVEVPLLYLDNDSYQKYCQELNDWSALASSKMPSAIVINTIWDSRISNRHNKVYISYLQDREPITLTLISEAELIIKASVFTETLPSLREEFPNYSLVLIMPEKAFEETAEHFSQPEYRYNVLSESEDLIPEIESKIKELLASKGDYKLESRIELEQLNQSIRRVYKIVIGILVGLLSLIGLGNVATNTFGLITQRKREFARYLSLGVSPKGLNKLLLLEAVLLGGRPILISLLLNIPMVIIGLIVSPVNPKEFLAEMPLVPIAVFSSILMVLICLAYYTGGRRLSRMKLMETLKDDTLI